MDDLRDSSSLRTVCIILIIILGAWLRIEGVDFGLPSKFRPDEEYLVSHGLGFHSGDLNPHMFIYPSLYMYVLGAVYELMRYLGEATPIFGLKGFDAYMSATESGGAHLIARITTALFGTASIYLTYLLGRKIWEDWIGILGAFFVAINFIHVRESHYATTDIPMTFLCLLALISMVEMAKRGGIFDYALAGTFTGLAISTKYPALGLGGPLLIASLLDVRRAKGEVGFKDWFLKLSVAGICVILYLIVGSPYILLDLKQFKSDWEYQLPFLRNGIGTVMYYGWRWVFLFALRYSLGIPLMIVGLASGAWIAWRSFKERFRRVPELILVVFIAFYSIPLFSSKWLFIRYVTPLMPVFALTTAAYVTFLILKLENRVIRNISFALVIVILGLNPLIRSVRHSYLLTQEDTRVQTEEWIKKNIPPGSKIAIAKYYFYAKPQFMEEYKYVDFGEVTSGAEPNVTWAMLDIHPVVQFSPVVPDNMQQLLKERGTKVASFSPFLGSPENSAFDLQDAFYLPIDGLENVDRPGPILEIYKLGSKPNDQ